MAQSRGGRGSRSGGASGGKSRSSRSGASSGGKSRSSRSGGASGGKSRSSRSAASSGGKSRSSRSSAAKSRGSRSSAAKKRGSRSSAAKKRSGGSRGGSRPKQTAAQREQEFSGKSVADLRKALTERLVEPLNLVMLTRERIEEAVEEAVSRGSMTRDAAQDLIAGLVERGRRQTTDVLGDLEQLLGRSRGGDFAARARQQVDEATTRARDAGDQVRVQADRARRVAGVGPPFPILGYDDLTARQVQGRLGTLTPAELRKVRDYEKRNANRKSVLSAIEAKLA